MSLKPKTDNKGSEDYLNFIINKHKQNIGQKKAPESKEVLGEDYSPTRAKSFGSTLLGKRIEKDREPSKIMQKLRREDERVKKNISVGQAHLDKFKRENPKPANSSLSASSRNPGNSNGGIKNNYGKNGAPSLEAGKKKTLDPSKQEKIEKLLEISRNYDKYMSDPNFNVDDLDLLMEKESKPAKQAPVKPRTIVIDADRPKIDASKVKVADIEKPKATQSKVQSMIGKLISKGKKTGRTYKIPGEPTVWCAKCKKEHGKDFHKSQIQDPTSATKIIGSNVSQAASKQQAPIIKPRQQQGPSQQAQNIRPKSSSYAEGREQPQKHARSGLAPTQRNPSQGRYEQPQNNANRYEKYEEEEEEEEEFEEEEEDLDDFIVDDDEEHDDEPQSYSHIRRLVHQSIGYNPNKYAHNDDRDIGNMEARFEDITREERFSSKVARQEDERELRYLQLEERMRALKRKKLN